MKDALNEIDIIIITYNSTDCLRQCLKSIFENQDDIHLNIYVINNYPSEHIDRASIGFPNVNVINSKRNYGFSKAVNRALFNTSSEFICILNPDTIVKENSFKNCVEFLLDNKKIGIIGPRICNSNGSYQGSARSFPTLLTAFFGRTSWLTKAYPNNSLSKKNMVNIDYYGNEPLEVDWVSGACMIVRRDAINNIGAMDERFFMYWEDADWCRRMRMGGWKVVYYPRTTIVHTCGQSSKTRPLKSILHFHKSCYQLYEKYNPSYKAILLPAVLLGLSLRVILLLICTMLKRKAGQKL